MMKHWAQKYIGKPWTRCARGPDEYDCWGLVHAIYKNEYGIELPLHLIDPVDVSAYGRAINEGRDHPEWIEQIIPKEGCVVPLSKSRIFHHVGIWLDIDNGLILHSYDGACVVAQTITTLKTQNWKQFKYYTHRDFGK